MIKPGLKALLQIKRMALWTSKQEEVEINRRTRLLLLESAYVFGRLDKEVTRGMDTNGI